MQPTFISFTEGEFLVEVGPDRSDPMGETYVARLSLLEDDGNVVRPLVFGDGGRVVIHAFSEPLALNSAISYLSTHFGSLSMPEKPWHPHPITEGRPYVVER